MSRDAIPHLPKTPFIVLDACLLITAIVIKVSAGPQPPSIIYFWMILCVLVGGLLACAPFFLEFRIQARLREHEATLASGDAQERLATAIASIQRMTDDTLAHLGRGEQIAKAMKALLGRFESRIGSLEEENRSAEALQQDLLEAVRQIIEREREEMVGRMDSANTEDCARWDHLEHRLDDLAAQLHPVPFTSVEEPEQESSAPESPAAPVTEPPAVAVAPEPEDDFDEEPEVSNEPESHQPTSDEVEAEPAEEALAHPPEAEDEPEPLDDEPLPEPADVVAPEPEQAQGQEAPVSAMMADDDWGDGWGEEDDGSEPEDEDLSASSEQPELLDAPSGSAKAAKAGPRNTTLIAQVLIGIGNKPYVRGEGPGLSMTQGVPMQFLEIGKWQWVAPDASEPVRVQIYKNDEVPATGDWIDIKPGQRRSVTPQFSS